MKFITKRNSKTGKKFAVVEEKLMMVRQAQSEMLEELGATHFRSAYWCVDGGFSAFCFPPDKQPDPKHWKNVNGSKDEWMPKHSTKEGKAINGKLKAMPRLANHELNSCIGFNESMLKAIGFAFNNDEYFGFSVQEDWNVKIPSDCEEVTVSRYKELFK